LNYDVIMVWLKVCAGILTGVSAAYGIFHEYRVADPKNPGTKVVSREGKIAVLGTVLGVLLSVALAGTESKKDSESAMKSEQQAEKSEAQAKSSQTEMEGVDLKVSKALGSLSKVAASEDKATSNISTVSLSVAESLKAEGEIAAKAANIEAATQKDLAQGNATYLGVRRALTNEERQLAAEKRQLGLLADTNSKLVDARRVVDQNLQQSEDILKNAKNIASGVNAIRYPAVPIRADLWLAYDSNDSRLDHYLNQLTAKVRAALGDDLAKKRNTVMRVSVRLNDKDPSNVLDVSFQTNEVLCIHLLPNSDQFPDAWDAEDREAAGLLDEARFAVIVGSSGLRDEYDAVNHYAANQGDTVDKTASLELFIYPQDKRIEQHVITKPVFFASDRRQDLSQLIHQAFRVEIFGPRLPFAEVPHVYGRRTGFSFAIHTSAADESTGLFFTAKELQFSGSPTEVLVASAVLQPQNVHGVGDLTSNSASIGQIGGALH